MKIILQLAQTRPGGRSFFCKISLMIIALLFCTKAELCSGIGHTTGKAGHAGTNGSKSHKASSFAKVKTANQLTLPTISYSGPQTYLAGTAITPLTPTSTGVSAPGYSSSATVLGSGFSIPGGVVVDRNSNIYVADGGNNQVKMMPPGGGTPIIIGSGFSNPTGVAVDGFGNIYVADYGNNAVKEILAGTNTVVTLGMGFIHPYGVAADDQGDVFVADNGNNAVKEILRGVTVPVVLGSGFIAPEGVAIDAAGNVYVADTGHGVIKEIPLGTGAPVIIGSGFNNPTGVAADAWGNLFVADAGNNAVKELFAGGNTPITVGPGFNSPAGVAVDSEGKVYVADQLNSAVKEIRPVGGYYITTPLPAGLSFSNSTGVISGTPTIQNATQSYAVVAYNSSGTGVASVSITVNALTINYGSAQTLIAGSAIAPIAPVSVGVASPAYSNHFIPIGSGFNHPFGVALDSHGNAFIADGDNYDVKEVLAGTNLPVIVYPGDGTITGVAVDLNGNVFASGASNLTAIEKVPAGGGAAVAFGSGFNLPYGVAADAGGNVFVTDGGAVKKIAPNNSAPVVVASGFNSPAGVTLDTFGNIFVADEDNNAIKEVPANGGAQLTLGSGFSLPTGVAVDNTGNVFVADYNNNAVKEIPAGGGNPITLSGAFSSPIGVTVDAADNLYVSDYGHNLVKEIAPVGGYYINPALPPGLVFNTTTGIISGTPVAQSLATNYTITAFNTAGSNTASIIIKVNLPALPAISYNGPQNYLIGSAITPLTPGSNGVAAAAYSTSFVNIGSGYTHPYGVAVDAAGDVFTSDQSTSAIKEFPVGGGSAITLGSGFFGPGGITLDTKGNLYIADEDNHAVKEIPFGGGAPISIGSGFSFPDGVAVDKKGNVYVSDLGNKSITMIPAGNGTPVTIVTGYDYLNSLAVDIAGNVYAAFGNSNVIAKYPANGGPPVFIPFGGNYALAIVIDAAGNLYVSDKLSNNITKVPVDGSAPVVVATGFNAPWGMTIDASGNLFVASFFAPSVVEIKPIGGYYINPALPAGLHFDSNTGIISGTPTAFSPAQNYTVTGYNLGGGSTAVVNIKVSTVSISYVSPQTYTVNTVITPLLPTYSGTASAGYPNSSTILAAGLNTALGVAVDAAGNVYVADAGTRNISKIPISGGATVIEGSGFTVPYGVAVDAAGNIYVADNSANNIKKIPFNGGVPVIIGSGFNAPSGVAVDARGNVYVGDAGSGAVKKIPFGGGPTITIASGFNYPAGVAVDSSGNVYVADQLNSAIKMIPAGGGAPVTLGSGFHQPTGVAVDGAGNVFVADQLNSAVKEILAGGNTVATTGAGFNQPYGVCVDGAGSVYVGDYGTGTVKKITPVGGFYINALPPGLTFSNTSGAIGGTPTVISPATNYAVTAYNAQGNGAATVNIKVTPSAVCTLSSLAISTGTLNPVFTSGTSIYTTNVGNGITSITLTPTATDPASTLKVNGATVTTGTASAALPLNIGPNTITTVVTAQDGVTTQTYTLTVTRAASINAKLLSLTTSSGGLSPAFSNTVTSYTRAVANTVTSITIAPATVDPTATITVNGAPVVSGTSSAGINLNVGSNLINTVVTAQDGTTKITYTINVIRAASADATLSNLTISPGTIKPLFTSVNTSYNVALGNGIKSVTVTPTTTDLTATIRIGAKAVVPGTASDPIPLLVGPNTIAVMITAQNGVTTKTYKIIVTRAPSSNAKLYSLTTSNGVLSPAFDNTITSYTRAVPNSATSITFKPTAVDKTSKITLNGVATPSGVSSVSQPLVDGDNQESIVVMAQDGKTIMKYTITVTRAMGALSTVYEPVSVEKPIESAQLENDGINVHQGVSPNGDGINDFLVIENIANYPDNKLQIMNRSGQLVFESKSYDNSTRVFDGHSNKTGAMQLQGTYFYTLDYTANGIAKHKTGFIVLKY